MQEVLPGMVVQKLEGVVVRPTRRYVKDEELSTPESKRYKMVDGEEKVPAGYLITFPLKGHSIRVDEPEMIRLKTKYEQANGSSVVSEHTGIDMTQILRASGGGSLVTVIQEGKGAK